MPPKVGIICVVEGASKNPKSLSPAHGNDRFFRRVFGLHMIHRTPRELRDLLEPAGFGEFVTLREPLGVYHVLVGRRAAAGDGEGTS